MVYSLRERLGKEPEYVRAVQARTLDSKPLPGGLKGTYGLFGSAQWWENIERGNTPITRLCGIITSIYPTGMEDESGFEMRSREGTLLYRYTCLSNRPADEGLFMVGKRIEVSYVTEPLKNPVRIGSIKAPTKVVGFQTHAEVVLEISIEE